MNMNVTNFVASADVSFWNKLLHRTKEEVFYTVKLELENGDVLRVGEVIQTNLGDKFIIQKVYDGKMFAKSLNPLVTVIPPTTIKVLPWKYLR